MSRIDLYTIEEIDKLVSFYSDRVVGKKIDGEVSLYVEKLEIEQMTDSKYKLTCLGYIVRQGIQVRIDILLLCKTYNLTLPEVVINGLY